MLYVQLFLDDYRYILSTTNVVEIVPGVRLTPLPNAPSYISGLCNYRGASVPVIDLCEIFLNRPCNKRLSTRIIFIKAKRVNKKDKIVGFLVERATETLKVEEDSFVDSGIHNQDMPFIGPVVADMHGLVTRILPDEIFRQIDDELIFGAA